MGFFTKKSVYWRDQLKRLAPLPAPTWESALTLFDHLADQREITYGFAASGCQARAHLMCREMVALGHLPGKAWIFESFGPLTVYLPGRSAMDPVNWCFHVAPTLEVDCGAPHGITPMVFDPSLFDGPVTPQQWCEVMHGTADRLHLVPLGHSAPGQRGDYLPFSDRHRNDAIAFTSERTDQLARDGMDEFRQYLQTPIRNVFSCGQRPPARGKTWCTYQAPPVPSKPQPTATNSRRL